MKRWDPDGAQAPVGGVPLGCRAVALVEVVERDGEYLEVRDRQRRRKTKQVVVMRDPTFPPGSVDDSDRRFAVGAGRRRWSTVVSRYGNRAFDVAVALLRGGVVNLVCDVDGRGNLGEPRWWEPTPEAAMTADLERKSYESQAGELQSTSSALIEQLKALFPEVATALAGAKSRTAVEVVTAAANDLLAGIEHAGPRAFSQSHFGRTKVHDVRGVLGSAGVPDEVLERLGLRRGDRIGLGGPILVRTASGELDLAPLRGPVVLRLDQDGLAVSTAVQTLVVVENLQPAEVICARHRMLAVVYTAGQFGSDTSEVLRQLGAGRRVVAIVDADLGGVRIAKRVLEALPAAEVVDVGTWPHPMTPRFSPEDVSMDALQALRNDASAGWLAEAILDRGYPVEQELATLSIIDKLVEEQ